MTLLSRKKLKRYLCTVFTNTLLTVLRREIGMQFDTSDGSYFFWIGETLASFQICGTLPELGDKLKRSSQCDRDCRANLMPIYGDLYQIKL